MSIRSQIEILLDEYASGERPQNEVTEEIMGIIDDNDQNSAYYEQGWADGYEQGSLEGYQDAKAGL